MKAVVCTKYGPPEVLVIKELKKPEPKKNEVLIKICATSVTASDNLIRGMKVSGVAKLIVQLFFGFGKPRNPILGMVLSGVVEKSGAKVNLFKRGDQVFAYGYLSPVKFRFGSYAEYICLPEDWNLLPKPNILSFEEAAALPYGGLLSWYFMKRANIQQGQKVLIYGASGSIGTMSIQFAKIAGAEVTSVCSGKNFNMVRQLGSDKVIDYKQDNAISFLEKYDFIFDAVGKRKTSALKKACKNALTNNGKYVSVDDKTPTSSKEDFKIIKELAEKGSIKPFIDEVFTLDQIVEAHRYVEKGHKRGNVVISVTKC